MPDEFVDKSKVDTEDTKTKDVPEDDLEKRHLDSAVPWDDNPHVPFGVRTFAAYDAGKNAEEAAEDVRDDADVLVKIVGNILNDIDDEDKAGSIAKVATEFSERTADRSDQMKSGNGILAGVMDVIKEAIANNSIDHKVSVVADSEKSEPTFMVWKDKKTGLYAWIGKFSNNFRDDDSPPEIIAAESHQNFIKSVPAKYDYPELRLWHRPEWMIGKSTWLAWDDAGDGAGFALAAGFFNKGMEGIAEALAKSSDIGMSHGMPREYLKRDVDDPTIITQHVTKEISVLPLWSAANRWTGFEVIDDIKEKNMSVPKDLRKKVEEAFGVDGNVIDRIEEVNAKSAAKNRDLEIEYKSNGDDTPLAADTTTPAATDAVEPVAAKPVAADADADVAPADDTAEIDPDAPLTRDEVAKALISLSETITTAVSANLIKQMKPFMDAVTELARDDDTRMRDKAAATPRAASVSDLLKQGIANANKKDGISDKEVDELGKPKEAKHAADGGFIGALQKGDGDKYLTDIINKSAQVSA